MTSEILRRPSAGVLLGRLIEAPDLVRVVRELSPPAFSALVRQVGAEDAGDVVALATTEQLVAAFDEDLFVNERPGEREAFDGQRFLVWLEVLLEAGEAKAARRVAELAEAFLVHALSSVALVFDNDTLLAGLSVDDETALYADKLIEGSLSEEIDGYLLVSKGHSGWDALVALVLALDRDHRAYLVSVLDRCAQVAAPSLDDLDELRTRLSRAESLAEDVEAAREERRTALGYVEPRAARAFLELARRPIACSLAEEPRDPITRAHFRERRREAADLTDTLLVGARHAVPRLAAGQLVVPRSSDASRAQPPGRRAAFIAALQILKDEEPSRFGERMEELAYLSNVLVAGAMVEHGRLRPAEAAEAALLTVALGAELEVDVPRRPSRGRQRATPEELRRVLSSHPADLLFRRASRTLANRGAAREAPAFVRTSEELERQG